MAVLRSKCRPDFAQIEKGIDPAQKMIVRDMVFQTKIVKKLLRSCLCSHHRAVLQSKSLKKMESQQTNPIQRLLQQNRSNSEMIIF